MAKTPPSVRHVWQDTVEDDQPTCYEARNPAMPWRKADELTFEDAEDRADACAWLGTGAPAQSIGALQKKPAAMPKPPAPLVKPIPDLFQLPILQQLAHGAQQRPKHP